MDNVPASMDIEPKKICTFYVYFRIKELKPSKPVCKNKRYIFLSKKRFSKKID